jgi:hypothetical protein
MANNFLHIVIQFLISPWQVKHSTTSCLKNDVVKEGNWKIVFRPFVLQNAKLILRSGISLTQIFYAKPLEQSFN